MPSTTTYASLLPCLLVGTLHFQSVTGQPQSRFPHRKVRSSHQYDPLRISRKWAFYGEWTDFFSHVLSFRADSGFSFSTRDSSQWIEPSSGTWSIHRDTIYLTVLRGPATPSVPDKLFFQGVALLHVDEHGQLMKTPMPAKTSRGTKLRGTFYLRSKKNNRDYFDSTYYQRATARRFRIGMGIHFMGQPVSGNPLVKSFGFTMVPRFLFDVKPKSYLSLDAPLTTGFTLLEYSVGPDVHVGAMADLPLILNYNHGIDAARSRFSYFAGGGAGYHLNQYTTAGLGYDNHQVNGFGPVLNAGIRFAMSKYRQQHLELRFSYQKMIVQSRPDIFGIGLLMNY